ncbi:MAG: DUF2520 domain-containing protein [Thermodesulfovibrionales bacterium]|nr:DUF2520 domain-containing protein [Thermodesulfovibrionales bacterium]
MHKVSIIGAGVVGTAMGYLLKHGGYPIVGIASRTLKSAKRAREFIGEGEVSTDLKATAKKADIVFITTPDDVIEDVCNKVASEGGFNPGAIVFHMSGALPSEILGSAKDVGAYVASLHPLQSLADVKEAVVNIPGSYFCIEGDDVALSAAREIVAALKGKEITLKVDKKPLYHAGAAAASNFLVTTVGFGLELFDAAGIDRQDSLNALMPLIKGTVKNIEKLRIPSALTGPISRGDTGVIEDHLRAISKERPKMLRLYTELGRYTVKVALEKGTIKENEAERIISLFDKHEEELKTET